MIGSKAAGAARFSAKSQFNRVGIFLNTL